MKKIIILLMMIMMSVSVYGVCTVTFDKSEYNPGETVEATMSCSAQQEKNVVYNLLWYNASVGGILLQNDTGTTPSTVDTPFFKTYQIPITGTNWTNANATLVGGDLEGFDYFNTTDTPGNALIISDCKFKPLAFIGADFSVDCQISDVDGNNVDNAHCVVFGTDTNGAPLQISEITSDSINGRFVSAGPLKPENIDEGTSYLAELKCHCETGDNKCWDVLGNDEEKLQGSTSIGFTTATWLEMNAFTRRSNFEARQVLTVCANVTAVDATERVNTENYYKVWCGDNFTSSDRVVIASTPTDEPDRRGLNPGDTLNHCWAMVIPEKRWMQGRTNNCLASAEVWVLNNENRRIKLYTDRTDTFNITISDLGINADWLITGDNNEILTTQINMSSDAFSDWMPDGNAGNIDVRLDLNQPEFVDAYTDSVRDGILVFQDFYDVQNIAGCSSSYCNGTDITCRLEVTNDGFIEIEVPVDNQSTACIDVVVTMNTYRNREVESQEAQVVAQEDIATKLADLIKRKIINVLT